MQGRQAEETWWLPRFTVFPLFKKKNASSVQDNVSVNFFAVGLAHPKSILQIARNLEIHKSDFPHFCFPYKGNSDFIVNAVN